MSNMRLAGMGRGVGVVAVGRSMIGDGWRCKRCMSSSSTLGLPPCERPLRTYVPAKHRPAKKGKG